MKSKVAFRTGNMRPAFNAMRTSTDELLQHWGLDVEAYKARSSDPKPIDQEKWGQFVSQLFPVQKLIGYGNFHSPIRIMINETGQVTSCHSQLKIEPEKLMRDSCKLLSRHAKFEPARGADGSPIKSYWQTTVVFAWD